MGGATLTFDTGAGQMVTIADDIADTTGDAAGAAGITKTGDGTLVLGGTNSYSGDTTIDGGILSLDGSQVSPVTVNGGGMLKGTGNLGGVTVNNGGVHAPGNSIGTQTVSGPYVNSGSLEVEVDAEGDADLLIVNGTVDISGAILDIIEAPGLYGLNTLYEIIRNDDADAVTGTFGAINNQLAFLTPVISTTAGDGNDVFLTMVRNAVAVTDVAGTENQQGVAEALDVLDLTPGSDGATVANAILGLSATSAQAAFDAMSGEALVSVMTLLAAQGVDIPAVIIDRLSDLLFAAGPTAGLSTSNFAGLSLNAKSTADILLANAGDLGDLDLASHPATSDTSTDGSLFQFWVRGLGSYGTFDGNANTAEADILSHGVLVGGDAALIDGLRLGLAGGYGGGTIEVDGRASEIDLESIDVVGYLSYALGWFHANLIGRYSFLDFESERRVVFGGIDRTATAQYDGSQFDLMSEIGYTAQLGPVAVRPTLGMRYGHVHTDGFAETGASAINLIAGDETVKVLDSIVGIDVAAEFTGEHVTLIPNFHAAWTHAHGDVSTDNSFAFQGGGTFTVTGAARDGDTATVGAGVAAVVDDLMGATGAIFLDASSTFAGNQRNFALSGGIKIAF
jgi:outer membrane autotransporter protein